VLMTDAIVSAPTCAGARRPDAAQQSKHGGNRLPATQTRQTRVQNAGGRANKAWAASPSRGRRHGRPRRAATRSCGLRKNLLSCRV
jgi:hypothetical protein